MTLDRRQVLGLAATSLAAMTLPRTAASAPTASRRRSKKALGLGMIGEGESLADKLKLAADLGFEGVELDAPNAFSTDEVLAARDAAGIAITSVVDSVHWNAPLSDPDPEVRRRGREGLEAAIRDAAAYGAGHVLLVPAVVNEKVAYDAAWERSTAEIRVVLPLADELGVSINVENVWNHFLLSPLEAARYVDQFESERVGWHFDVGNIVNYGWPEQWIRILGTRIRRVHVKEYSRKKRNDEGLWKGFAVEIGEGDCGWDRVMAAFDEIGYEGWFIAEVGGGKRDRLSDVAARMDRVLSM